MWLRAGMTKHDFDYFWEDNVVRLWMPWSFYWVSLLFLIAFLVTLGIMRAIFRNDKDQLSLAQLCVVLAYSCMYLMWVTCYLQQLYPIIRPEKPPHFD
jgi:endonuclease/exonuclease/phosphatase (EEP) superfamily protein YafD